MATSKRASAGRANSVPAADNSLAEARRVIDRCRKLAQFTDIPGTITRTFLSPPMHDCHRELASWLEPLGAEIRIDAAGNFRALHAGADDTVPRLLIGSHLDTVPDAGAFDGVLGVVLAVTLLENLQRRRLPLAIELLGFSEEEGVRFGTPFIGSRALAGRLDGEILDRTDSQGTTVRDAIRHFGLDANAILSAALTGDILGYIEFHIEQGPVLESLNLPLAAVEAIAGQSRLDFTFLGSANHAGTTPMHLRRDAVAAAAEWIGAVERKAQSTTDLVATVGAIEAKPNAGNVIAGEVRSSLDVRHRQDRVRLDAVDTLIRAAEEIASRRGISVRHTVQLNQPAVTMDSSLVEQIEHAMRESGCKPHRMVSGAGHDALILAEQFPTAMIFLRTPGGISHNPQENVHLEDVAKAIETGSHLLQSLVSSLAQRRIKRA
jgi:allantoate deiminase